MPIKGLTDRQAAFPMIGAIRKGAPKPTDGRPRPGADLQYFRVEFDEAETSAAAAFREAYPAQPREINILFPFEEADRNLIAYYEAYVAGALVYRSDGERVLYELDPATGQRKVVNGEPYTSHRENPIGHYVTQSGRREPINWKATGRMHVIVPELKRLAYLVVHTTSIHDVMNLASQLEAIRQLHGFLRGVPLVLRRRPRKISMPGEGGKRVRRVKYLLSVEADPEWVKAKLTEVRALAMPAAAPLMLQGAPASAPAVLEHGAPAAGDDDTRSPLAQPDAGDDDDEGELEEEGFDEGDLDEAATKHGRQYPDPEPAASAPPANDDDMEDTRAPKVAAVKVRKETKAFTAALRELVGKWPGYQVKARKGQPATGQPNMFHITAAAYKCGFPEITDQNYQAVIEAIDQRASQKTESAEETAGNGVA